MTTTFTHGWNPSPPDHRDRFFHLEEHILQSHQLPDVHDLYAQGPTPPSIWNQSRIGSCTAHGSLRSFLTEAVRQGLSIPMLSRLLQYYDTRLLEGTTATDSGASVRSAVRSLAVYGAAPEDLYPYIIENFASPPPDAVVQAAKQHMAIKYQSVVPTAQGASLRTALVSGLAVVGGFRVPTSFEDGSWDPATTPLPFPDQSTSYIGGHCVAWTGYDFSNTDFPPFYWIDNSWGPEWGDKGRFRMDAKWVDSGLADDLWVIQAVR